MNENLSELLAKASSRTVTIRTADGRSLAKVKLLHAAIAAATGVIMAPRITAAAAVGALVSGVSVSVDEAAEQA